MIDLNLCSRSHIHVLEALEWFGEAKVSCILRHRGVQLIFAYSWTSPVILAAGKGRGECFYFFWFFTFIHFPLSPLSRSFISSTMSSSSLLPFSGRRHKMTHKGWRVVKPQHNQYCKPYSTFSLTWFKCILPGLQTFLDGYLKQKAK